MESNGLARGQEPADPRRVIAALQNLDAIEQLTRSTPGGWHPREDSLLAQQLRNLAIAGILELHPFDPPGTSSARLYRPDFTALGALTVFDVLGVARSSNAARQDPAHR